jgi:hypothetical protein
VHANLLKANPTTELQINTPFSSQPKKHNSVNDIMEKVESKEEPPKKMHRGKKGNSHQRGRKISVSF